MYIIKLQIVKYKDVPFPSLETLNSDHKKLCWLKDSLKNSITK